MESKEYIIYKITNLINGKIYIGVTSRPDIRSRFIEHISGSNWSGRKSILHIAISKYGKDNFNIEIIEKTDSIENMFILENKYIIKYDSFYLNGKGYNMTFGGEGRVNSVTTEETKKLLSLKGQEFNKTKRGIEIRNAAANKLRGRRVSEEERENKRKVVPNKTSFTIMSPSKEIIHAANLTQFCKLHNLSRGALREVLRGKQKSHKGWTLPGPEFIINREIKDTDSNGMKSTFKLLSPNNEIIEYTGLSEFCRIHGLNRTCIRYVLNGKYKTHQGWKLPV
jgi:group I intron endonuclease